MRAALTGVEFLSGSVTKKMDLSLRDLLWFIALSVFLPCLLLFVQSGCTAKPANALVPQSLQGTWEGVILGQESNNKVTIRFTGNSLHFQWLEGNIKGNWYEANFVLPAGTNPQQLRATITGYHPTNDIGTRDIGVVLTAIIKICDGTLTLAGIQGTNQERLGTVEAFEDNSVFRYTFRKVQR